MAGWFVIWTHGDVMLNAGRLASTSRLAQRYGGATTQFQSGKVALSSWRRSSGEFPLSGKIVKARNATVSWLGQCLEDAGDVSDQAITLLVAEDLNLPAISRLNGPFAAVVFRTDPFELRLVTDRHRHYPIYLYRGKDVVVASTELRCLTPWMDKRTIDRDSVDMLLRCGELIDRMTIMKGVEVLPPGTVFSDSGHQTVEYKYWSMNHAGALNRPIDTIADQLAGRLETAVKRIEKATPRLGITLSGGLDSRLILDLCENASAIPSFTWGNPGCRDIACASLFAASVESPHTVKHWDPSAFPPLWSRGVDLTGGAFGTESMFMLPFTKLLASSCDVVLNGLAGDAILGGNFLKYSWLQERDLNSLGRAVWRWRVSCADDELVCRLTGRVRGPSSSEARWVDSISARDGGRPVERLNDWLYDNRVFRNTNCGTMLLRGELESHAPFFDRDFVDLVLQVHPEQKLKHRLYLEVINRNFPRTSSVPWQRTNIKPARGYAANLMAMATHRLVTKAGSLIGVQPFKTLTVADPSSWIRGNWRETVAGLLFDRRALDRQLVDENILRKMWSDHLNGANHSRQIGVLIAVELFARQMIDANYDHANLVEPTTYNKLV